MLDQCVMDPEGWYMKIPFLTYFRHDPSRQYYVNSETLVYMSDGKQWRHIANKEFTHLLVNPLFTGDIKFRSHCCLNVLLILRDGI